MMGMPMKRAVFLDRDGTINRGIVRDGKSYAPTTVAEFELLPGAEGAIRSLREAGFLVVVVTNQPDVGAMKVPRETVETMHAKLLAEGLCDAVEVCYHTEGDSCNCRKPKPGMLLRAARELKVDLSRSYMVGDRWRDVGAGKAAGCYTFFIDRDYTEENAVVPDSVVGSLEEAAAMIISGALTPAGSE